MGARRVLITASGSVPTADFAAAQSARRQNGPILDDHISQIRTDDILRGTTTSQVLASAALPSR